jgi:excinuclease ABC subunit A
VLDEIGLGYLRLGQPATTLSGGEAQRIKIAAHLASSGGERVLYILDEPTTGLHFDDIAKLLAAFRKLAEAGHTLVVIEHNLDVIKTADYIIDLGPEGGEGGGEVVASGTPEQVAANQESHTGRALRPVLVNGRTPVGAND